MSGGPYREAPVRHEHHVDVNKDEIIEAVNLLREKRGLPLAPVDATTLTTRMSGHTSLEPNEHGAAVIITIEWENIE